MPWNTASNVADEAAFRPRLGISSCLLGERVRYDGGHRRDRYLVSTLGSFVEWVPVCPEVECGLPVPREAMHLVGDPEQPRLVTKKTRIDHTRTIRRWTDARLHELSKLGLCGFIFKSNSPSSGIERIKVYDEEGRVISRKGSGIFAGAFIKRFPALPVEEDARLHDLRLRENFIERVFVVARWQREVQPLRGRREVLRAVIDFHSDHKLIIMAHGAVRVRELERLTAEGKAFGPAELKKRYLTTLMHALRRPATVKKNVNVLLHILGHFKLRISAAEKQEVLEVIDLYHRGLVPLVVPITLLSHHVRKYELPHLMRQHYLQPHPVELMLRNHA